jgi:N-methylhydantoinase A
VHDVVNENMAGAARVAIAERGRVPVRDYALLATGGAGRRFMPGTSRASSASRASCSARRAPGAGSTIGMLMAPARVDRVASFTTCRWPVPIMRRRRASSPGWKAESLEVLRC